MSEKMGSIMYFLGIVVYTLSLIKIINLKIGLIISFFFFFFILILYKYYKQINNGNDEDSDYNDEKYIDIALKKVELGNLDDKLFGLEHLCQKYTHDRSYYGLSDILQNEKDITIKKILIDYLCKMNYKRKENDIDENSILKNNI